MKQTRVFDLSVASFSGSFSFEELYVAVANNPEWHKDENYARSCLRDRMNKGHIVEVDNNLYSLDTNAQRRRVPNEAHNHDNVNQNLEGFDYAGFYNATMEYFYSRVSLHRDSSGTQLTRLAVERYFSCETQSIDGEELMPRNSINRVFLRMCFHRQNSRRTSNFVHYRRCFDVLRRVTHDFDPALFIASYPTYNEDQLLLDIYGDIERTKPMRGYVSNIYTYAKYLADNFCGQEDPYGAFINYYTGLGRGAAFALAREVPGLKTLAFDFFKELDVAFNFYAKPDIHIKAVMERLFGVHAGNMASMDQLARVSEAVHSVAESINNAVPEANISAYKLDKILYIICSDTFYLDDNISNHDDGHREAYFHYLHEQRVI